MLQELALQAFPMIAKTDHYKRLELLNSVLARLSYYKKATKRAIYTRSFELRLVSSTSKFSAAK